MSTGPHRTGRKSVFFFFNDTATTEIYTLSLHDALPISLGREIAQVLQVQVEHSWARVGDRDRKSTRLNSSHSQISYAVFCLKKNTIRRSARRDPRPPRLTRGDGPAGHHPADPAPQQDRP